MKNLLSVLPILSAVRPVAGTPSASGIIHQENAGIGASSAGEHLFVPICGE